MPDPPSAGRTSAQRNGEWRLPFDAISRRPTIFPLMKTCSTLYTEGPQHLLRDGVELASADEIDKLTAFMLAEGPSRFAYLRKLTLLANLHDGAHLVQLLSHPSLALETLVLHQAEICLGRFVHPALCAAICGLKTVKHLVLFEVEEEHTASLSCLPRALAHISIHAKCGVGDTLRMLRPLSDTLRTLLISSEPQFYNRFRRMDLPPCHFPHVQTFGIVYNEFSSDILSSPAFSQAFPAITHLQLIPTDPPTARRRTPHPKAQKSWVRYHPRTSVDRHTPPSWPSLAECSGGLRNVHSLGLPCTLSTLRLWQDVEADELRVLRGALERTRPRSLCLSTEFDDVESLFVTLQEPPERVDVKIFVPKEAPAMLLSVLEALLQEIPTGLVELNVHVDIPSVYWPADKSDIRETLAAFMDQTSTAAAPSLRLTCRLSEKGDGEQWQWPDLHSVRARERSRRTTTVIQLSAETQKTTGILLAMGKATYSGKRGQGIRPSGRSWDFSYNVTTTTLCYGGVSTLNSN